MKKILISIILILTSVSYVFSQGIEEPFSAKSGLTEAINKAKSEGLNNPILIGIGLESGEYFLPDVGSIFPEFDITTGMSSVWLYKFAEEKNQNNTLVIMVAQLFSGFYSSKVEYEITNYPIDYTTPIKINWIDSDVLSTKLKQTKSFNDFSQQGDLYFDFVTLDYQTEDELIGLDNIIENNYWITGFSNENESIICYTNAINQNTICFTYSDVIEINKNFKSNFEVFPNPAKEIINIIFNEKNLNNSFIKIYDYFGKLVIEKQISMAYNKLTLDISILSPGIYTILYNNQYQKLMVMD